MGCGASKLKEPPDTKKEEKDNKDKDKKNEESPPGSEDKTPENKISHNNVDKSCQGTTESSVSVTDSQMTEESIDKNNHNKTKLDKIDEEKTIDLKDGDDTTLSEQNTDDPAKVDPKDDSNNNNNAESAQGAFDTAVRCSCSLVKETDVLKFGNEATKLSLLRSLPSGWSAFKMLASIPNLQEVNISGSQLGPQAFRAVMLSLCHNTTLKVLNIANNMADTDSAIAVGKMLLANKALLSLDLSGNYLGKDFFSRNVGPAMKENKTLQMLKLEGIGSTDLKVFMEGVQENNSLCELVISHNEMANCETFMTALSGWLKRSDCPLRCLEMKNCGLGGIAFENFANALGDNNSLQVLNVNSNQAEAHSSLMDFILACMKHSTLLTLSADDIRITKMNEWKPASTRKMQQASPLQSLSLGNCRLEDKHLESLASVTGGLLTSLEVVNLSNNPALTLECFNSLLSASKGDSASRVSKLSFSLNDADKLPGFLKTGVFPQLKYLNLRKSKLGADALALLKEAIGACGLEILILDGIKLSGNKGLADLFDQNKDSPLLAVSLSGCQLQDKDVAPLFAALKNGLPLTMLKLSANRISDTGVDSLVNALTSQATHPLKLMDLSNNRIGDQGSAKLHSLLTNTQHKSEIHSLNLSSNTIGAFAAKTLVSLVGKTSLISLQLNKQENQFDEEDVEDIYKTLVLSLGIDVKSADGVYTRGEGSLPQLPRGLNVRLDQLGGETGELGPLVECAAFITDFRYKCLPYLSTKDALEISSFFKGNATERCVLSQDEWVEIIGGEKQSPSWLMVASHRDTAVFLSHLPASVTEAKLEGLLESEADCNVKEVYLLKDPVTKKNNGLAWVLMADTPSVERAVKLRDDGGARLFGQVFVISNLNVEINDEASSQAEARAKEDLKKRQADRKADDAAHRNLIQESYVSSQERHAYRLAHPAYADGRIW